MTTNPFGVNDYANSPVIDFCEHQDSISVNDVFRDVFGNVSSDVVQKCPPTDRESDMNDWLRNEDFIRRRKQREQEASDTAGEAFDQVIKDREEGLIDPDFQMDWVRTKNAARGIQDALIKGDAEAIAKLMKELDPQSLKAVARLMNSTFEHMGISLSVAADSEGRLVILDRNTNKGIALSEDGTVDPVMRRSDGRIIDDSRFDPFALNKMSDRLQSDIEIYRILHTLKPF